MWTHFDFWNNANPYITTRNDALFFMVLNYRLTQKRPKAFHAEERTAAPTTYAGKKAALRDFAIEWQARFGDFDYSYCDLAEWGDFFAEYGRKYGLLREFAANGII